MPPHPPSSLGMERKKSKGLRVNKNRVQSGVAQNSGNRIKQMQQKDRVLYEQNWDRDKRMKSFERKDRGQSHERNKNRGESHERKNRGESHERNKNRGESYDRNKHRGESYERKAKIINDRYSNLNFEDSLEREMSIENEPPSLNNSPGHNNKALTKKPSFRKKNNARITRIDPNRYKPNHLHEDQVEVQIMNNIKPPLQPPNRNHPHYNSHKEHQRVEEVDP